MTHKTNDLNHNMTEINSLDLKKMYTPSRKTRLERWRKKKMKKKSPKNMKVGMLGERFLVMIAQNARHYEWRMVYSVSAKNEVKGSWDKRGLRYALHKAYFAPKKRRHRLAAIASPCNFYCVCFNLQQKRFMNQRFCRPRLLSLCSFLWIYAHDARHPHY